MNAKSSEICLSPKVWLHASDIEDLGAMQYLATRISQIDPTLKMVLTTSEQVLTSIDPNLKLTYLPPPKDTHAATQKFIAEHQAVLLIWAGAKFRTNLLSAASRYGLHLLLVNVREKDLQPQRLKFLPNSRRRTLKYFSKIYAVNAFVAGELTGIGIPDDRLCVKGALQDATATSLTKDSRSEAFSQATRGRPLWLAASVGKFELQIILRAQETILKTEHRNLLVILPNSECTTDILEHMAAKSTLKIEFGSDNPVPLAETQVFIASSLDSLQSWYSISPVVFLGQSLGGNEGGIDPYVAASHGCALIYGPKISNFLTRYSKLADFGAARIVTDKDTLATAIIQITAPSTAANMTLNAWNALTQGAEFTDQIAEDVVAHLEKVEFKT